MKNFIVSILLSFIISPVFLLFSNEGLLFSEDNSFMLSKKEEKKEEVLLWYVSPNGKNDRTGTSKESPADFLDMSFWRKVNNSLREKAIKVVFLEGDYHRVFTEKPLVFNGIGNSKYTLTLEGVPDKTIFTANPAEYEGERGVLIDIVNSQNIHVRNFSFTGNGKVGYALRVTSRLDEVTENILIENCTWKDMRGIVYGATGVHQKNTKNVTYLKCVFERIGIDSHSHHIYNAYNPSYIFVIDSHFEDCTGDFVRFRDNTDFCVISGCKFIRNEGFRPYPFISMPNFNKTRTESFANNYAFFNNEFINNGEDRIQNAIAFHHYGFNREGYSYLLTLEEGKVLESGTSQEKIKVMQKNFGLNPNLIRIHNNVFSGKIKNKIALGSFPSYGSESKGWKGFGDIYDVVKKSNILFDWELRDVE